MLQRIRAKNLLSFGPDGLDLELKPLNVLIGANGSGKSNFLELISLLQSLPTDLSRRIATGGGIGEWLWKKGNLHPLDSDPIAILDVDIDGGDAWPSLHHVLELRETNGRFELYRERIKGTTSTPSVVLYDHEGDRRSVQSNGQRTYLDKGKFTSSASILSQLKDPTQYREITWLAKQFERIRIYRNWTFGQDNPLRRSARTDEINDVVAENYVNLPMVLNRLEGLGVTGQIVEALKELYEDFDGLRLYIEGGTVQVIFNEVGAQIPSIRLSDGTLRFLCLLAILLNPDLPPLICIEEPELGLHPDAVVAVGQLLIDASQRTQLIVTTHSDTLVDCFGATPESVVVCEKHEGQTKMARLDKERMSAWLGDDSLGNLWRSGQIGGNRW